MRKLTRNGAKRASRTTGLALATTLAWAGVASAQEATSAEESSESEAAPTEEAPAEGAPASEDLDSDAPKAEALSEPAAGEKPAGGADGARFRFGVSGGVGGVFATGLDAFYGGMDLRFGAQINHLLGVYLQPQLGFYGQGGGVGGLVGASVLADFTFLDRMFVGGGLGYGVVNNPSGFEVHVRAGGYPVMRKYDDRARRKGLMVGMDLRLYFTEIDTVVSPMVSVGYEAF